MKMSPLVVGAMRLGKWGVNMNTQAYEAFVRDCLELGLVDFDHADIYGSYTTEEEFGKILLNNSALRKEMRITTKCGIKMLSEHRPNYKVKSYDSSAKHIIASAEHSLKMLNTDYIDLLLLHRPDYLMDPQEIVEGISKLKQAGKVLHFGVSNFTNSQIEMLDSHVKIENHQIEASLIHLDPFEDGSIDQCSIRKITPTIWSPFGGGQLFENNSKDLRIVRVQKVLEELVKKHDASFDQILLAWLLAHPIGLIPILGTTKISRIRAAKKALTIKLTREDWYQLWQASKGHEVP